MVALSRIAQYFYMEAPHSCRRPSRSRVFIGHSDRNQLCLSGWNRLLLNVLTRRSSGTPQKRGAPQLYVSRQNP